MSLFHPNVFQTQINLISRETGKLVYKFYSETFCFFHIINQYEILDHVVIDICTYRDATMLNSMYINTMKVRLLCEEF
jgi:carotenoid cleavage dioxygenase-like enzyme